jgi:multimeric flavodoxin WrbA
MPVVSANYWNNVHGANDTPSDVAKDEEGLQTMRILGNNMAWLLQCIALGKEKGIAPKTESKIRTNFIK